MPPKYDNVVDLNPLRNNWRIKVGVICLWKMPSYTNPSEFFSLEMVFCDGLGGYIHGYVKKCFMQKFKDQLEEGKVYAISKFLLGQNGGSYRTCMHSYKINFQFSTVVKLLEDDKEISFYEFDFVPFPDISLGVHDDSCLVDIIGLFTGKSDVLESNNNGKSSKCIDIELTDLEKNKLSCTFWDHYCQMLEEFLKDSTDKPIVILLQWCKIKDYPGNNGVRKVSNSLYSTRLLINPQLKECQDFLSRISEVRGTISSNVSQISNSSSVAVEEDLLTLTVAKKIDELGYSCADINSCVILGTVLSIDTAKGWYYNSCRRCKKKVIPDGDGFFCEKYGNLVDSVVPRFKIELKVVDESGCAVFILFDREVNQVLGCTAAELIEGLVVESPCNRHAAVFSDIDKETLTINLEDSSENGITPAKRLSGDFDEEGSPLTAEVPSENSSNKLKKIMKVEP
ncbi:replication protein A 70 kDa DNA-binding subunit B-like [Senna tora]|uniref:Replication protein A 70 kDa DNA-binding subunit B-like n=1 Tax=Senna tora TaxID=362788 RepID=A0A834TSB4_9FABA|nr:replication protein A 70 kDa DNA-binding subunit B-like [Senna tora]